MMSRWYPSKLLRFRSRALGFRSRASRSRFSLSAHESSPSWSSGDCSVVSRGRGDKSSLLVKLLYAASARLALCRACGTSRAFYPPHSRKMSSSSGSRPYPCCGVVASGSLWLGDSNSSTGGGLIGTTTCRFSFYFQSAASNYSFDGEFFGIRSLFGVLSLLSDEVFFFFSFFSGVAGSSGSRRDSTTPM